MTTATELKQPPISPPAPTAPAVRAHRRALELQRDALEAGTAEAALRSARGEVGAKEALNDLYLRLKTLDFEIDVNYLAVELAQREDADREKSWRQDIHLLDPEDAITGIGKSACCARCQPGLSCVITSADPRAGPVCGHPILTKDLQYLDETGRRLFAYRDTPRCAALYAAACRRLKVSP